MHPISGWLRAMPHLRTSCHSIKVILRSCVLLLLCLFRQSLQNGSVLKQAFFNNLQRTQQAFFNNLIVAIVWRKRKRETDGWPWLHTPYLLLSYLRIKARKPLRLIMPMAFTVSLLHIPLHSSTISYPSKNQGEHAVRYYPVDDLNFMLIMICSTYRSAVSGARWGQAHVWPHWWPWPHIKISCPRIKVRLWPCLTTLTTLTSCDTVPVHCPRIKVRLQLWMTLLMTLTSYCTCQSAAPESRWDCGCLTIIIVDPGLHMTEANMTFADLDLVSHCTCQ